ncbi:hypothetical protein N9F65_00105 [bacterium]|nr:hypothetical protein [bacterium]MDB4501618.1 hypothetical protein [Akkermansiaceae bacterium]MDB4618710.1 hypothetical protein [bacterium]MDC0283444.1 hypothetical protein [Akkermansiaceae bacterium]
MNKTRPSAPDLHKRSHFLEAVRESVKTEQPFAAGRNRDGRHWMGYQLALASGASGLRLRAFETALKFHCLKQNGIYPTTTDFILRFNKDYVSSLQQLDFYALKGVGNEAAMMRAYNIPAKLIECDDLHPDRSPQASDPTNCYLNAFSGKRVLLISPIAELLAQRSNQETFEGVWSKINKPWFFPSKVIPVEIPFAMSRATRDTYPTVLDLCHTIMESVEKESFDVALIGASGLGIPLAARIKRLGKIAVSIGSDLQILFGVRGKRWRERVSWQRRYFNDYWTDVPAKYFFPEKDEMVEGGAYW